MPTTLFTSIKSFCSGLRERNVDPLRPGIREAEQPVILSQISTKPTEATLKRKERPPGACRVDTSRPCDEVDLDTVPQITEAVPQTLQPVGHFRDAKLKPSRQAEELIKGATADYAKAILSLSADLAAQNREEDILTTRVIQALEILNAPRPQPRWLSVVIHNLGLLGFGVGACNLVQELKASTNRIGLASWVVLTIVGLVLAMMPRKR